MGSSGGGGSTTSTSTYSPPPAVAAAYAAMTPQATALAAQPYPDYTPGAASAARGYNPYLVSPQTPNQIAAGQNIADLAGYYQPYANTATDLQLQGAMPIHTQQFGQRAINQYMSPYLQNVMGSTVANINETNAQQQQQLQSNAISRGAFGGDRAGIAQAELARQQNLANNATLANIANTGYNTALGEFNAQNSLNLQRQAANNQFAQAAGANIANIGQIGQGQALNQANAQYNIGAQQQQQNQAELSTAYQNFLNKQAYPYQQLGWLSGIISGVASGSGGTSSGSQTAPGASGVNQALGGIGALGSLGNMTGAFGSSGWLTGGSGLLGAGGGLFGAGAGAAETGLTLAEAAPFLMFKDGGRITIDQNHYDAGGVVSDQQKSPLLGSSPIAGMAAQQMVPNAPQATATPHVPQLSFAAPKQSGIDQTALKSAVTGIKYMMGKGGDEQQKSHGGEVHGYAAGGMPDAHGIMTSDPGPNTPQPTAPSNGLGGLGSSIANLKASQAHYTQSLPQGGTTTPSTVSQNPSMQPGDAYNAYQGLASSGHANLADLNKAYSNYKSSFGNVAPTDIINHFQDTWAAQQAADAKAAADAAAAQQNSYSYGPPDRDGSGGCCFNPDALVMMADRTWKKIKDIVEGDAVIGIHLKPNTVLGLKKTTVGNRPMKKFIDAGFYSTDDHLFMTDNGWKTFNPQRLVDNNAENLAFISESNKSSPINDGDRLLYIDILGSDLIPSFINYREDAVVTFPFPEDYVVYDLHLDGDNTYVVDGFVVHNCGGNRRGGRIHGYAQGGITNYGGMQTSKDLQNIAESAAGSGLGALPGSIEALAARDLLPQENARGGVIRALAKGGPSDDGGGSDDAQNFSDAVQRGDVSKANAVSDAVQRGDVSKNYAVRDLLQRADASNQYAVNDAVQRDFSPQALRSYALQKAQQLGVNPKMVDHIGTNESQWQAGASGDGKSSFGPLQLHYGNVSDAYPHSGVGDAFTKETGLDARDPRTAYEQIDYGLNHMKNNGFGAWSTAKTFGQQGAPAAKSSQQNMGGQGQAPQSKNLFGMSDDANYALLMASLRMMGTPGNVGMGLAAAGDTFAKTMAEQRKLSREQMGTEAEAAERYARAEEAKTKATTGRYDKTATGIVRYGDEGPQAIKIAPAEGSAPVASNFEDYLRQRQSATPGTQGGSGQTSAAPSAGGAPQAPQAPQAPSGGQPITVDPRDARLGPITDEPATPYQNNKLAYLEYEASKLGDLANSTQGGDAIKQFNNIYDAAQADNRASASARPALRQLTDSVTQLPETGLLATGAAAPYRYAVANYANTLSNMLNLGIQVNPDAITSSQEIAKINAIKTQADARGLGHQAASWLDTQRLANPNETLSKKANNAILAQQWIASGMSKDRANTFEEYGRLTNRTGYNAESVYQAANPSAAVYKEQQAVEGMLNQTKNINGRQENMVTLLLKGQMDPKDFDAWAAQHYHVRNLSRIFLN